MAASGQRSVALPYLTIPETKVFQINILFNNLSTGAPFIVYVNEKQGRVLIFATQRNILAWNHKKLIFPWSASLFHLSQITYQNLQKLGLAQS